MLRTCAGCGREFEGRRATAKYCSEACGRRVRRANATAKKSKKAPRVSGVVDAVRAELEEAGRLDTVLGRAALEVADALAATHTTGSAKAALSKELRAVMAEALRGSEKKSDALDELRKRREQKQQRAG